jgi:hypothetical protein
VNTLEFILKKFKLENYQGRMPIEIASFGRWDGLTTLFRELGFKTGVEIGVEIGKFSERLCKKNPDLHLYSIDPWKHYSDYRDHVDQGKLDAFYEETKNRMASYNCTIIRKFSMDAVKDFADRSLDFVYIDGNHNFQNVTNDICEWRKKVRVGGILSGHDYRKMKGGFPMHVAEVVQGYTAAYHISPWFVFGSRVPNEENIHEESRSFMWVE